MTNKIITQQELQEPPQENEEWYLLSIIADIRKALGGETDKLMLDELAPYIERIVKVEQEPVMKVIFNGTQYSIQKPDGGYWDMTKHVGKSFYIAPPDQSAKITELEAQLLEAQSVKKGEIKRILVQHESEKIAELESQLRDCVMAFSPIDALCDANKAGERRGNSVPWMLIKPMKEALNKLRIMSNQSQTKVKK